MLAFHLMSGSELVVDPIAVNAVIFDRGSTSAQIVCGQHVWAVREDGVEVARKIDEAQHMAGHGQHVHTPVFAD